jgi:hypothetical protein
MGGAAGPLNDMHALSDPVSTSPGWAHLDQPAGSPAPPAPRYAMGFASAGGGLLLAYGGIGAAGARRHSLAGRVCTDGVSGAAKETGMERWGERDVCPGCLRESSDSTRHRESQYTAQPPGLPEVFGFKSFREFFSRQFLAACGAAA